MTSMLLDQPAELTWGSFVFGSETDPDVPWICKVLVGTEFGDPVPIIEFIQSLRKDGSDAVVTGYDNRSFPVILEFEAPDGQAMSQAENTLWAQVDADVRPPLVWTPPMLGSWPLAFDVSMVKPKRQYDQDFLFDEAVHRVRRFEFEFTTSTWVRDLEPIEVPALPVPPLEPTIVAIDACDSSDGWSSPGVVTADETGFVRASESPAGAYELTRSGVVVMGSTPYIRISAMLGFAPSGSWPVPTARFTGPGGAATGDLAPVATQPSALGAPWLDYYYLPELATVETLTLSASWEPLHEFLGITHVARTDTISGPGAPGFQVARTITVEGAAPTGAAIILDSGEAPLIGSTALIYTGPSEVISLRELDTSSAIAVPNNAMMSGAENDLSEPVVSLVPVARLAEASYDVFARLDFTGTEIVSWSARLVAEDGSDIPGSDVVVSGQTLLRNDTTEPMRIHNLATIDLPVVKISGATTHQVEIKVWMVSGGAGVTVDERWLVDTRGGVTIVHEPSDWQLTRIEIQSPQLGFPRYEILGTWDGYGAQSIIRLALLGTHEFPPGQLHIFTATDIAKYAACSLRYYRKYPWHAGPAVPELVA